MKNSSIKKFLIYLLSISSILLIFVIVSLIINNEIIFPKLPTVFYSFIHLISQSKTYLVILYTFIRLLFSLVIGGLIAFILALLALKFNIINTFLKPYFYILRSIPLVTVLLIIMVLVNLNKTPIVITILLSIPIFYDSIYEGMTNIDGNLNNVWSLETKLNVNVIKKVLIPLSWSNIKVGIINAVSTGIKVVIMAEFICGTPNSVGNSLISASNNLDYALVFSWTILIILIVVISNNIAKLLKK